MTWRQAPIHASAELARIRALPVRHHDDAEIEALAATLTRAFKTPQGTMALRPLQALGLREFGTQRGGLVGAGVGRGKTLLSLLAPAAVQAERPVLLLPAALKEKTIAELRILCNHWRIPLRLRFYSYQELGLVTGAETLERARPDLIIADEAHRLKNKRAGVTRRVSRYMDAHPETMFLALSGTFMKHSIRDFAHIAEWCLKDRSPLPIREGDVIEWANALDDKVNPLMRKGPGAIISLAPPEVTRDAPTEEVAGRRAFQWRLRATPGVVFTTGDRCDASLLIRALDYTPSPLVDQHFETLRAEWTTPDGWTMTEAVVAWARARELALGFHGVWDPRPSDEWLAARKAWAKFVRDQIKDSGHLDTELAVVNEVKRGKLDDRFYKLWSGVRDTFRINPRDVWHDDAALSACETWMRSHNGIVWCKHNFFARELARRTGRPYYGAGAVNAAGRPILEAKPSDGPIIASIDACGTGQNLQAFDQNLITCWPSGADAVEQLIGRTHREGQESDEVTVDFLLGCYEHYDSWEKCLSGAAAARDTLGNDQKVLVARALVPEREAITARAVGPARFRWSSQAG